MNQLMQYYHTLSQEGMVHETSYHQSLLNCNCMYIRNPYCMHILYLLQISAGIIHSVVCQSDSKTFFLPAAYHRMQQVAMYSYQLCDLSVAVVTMNQNGNLSMPVIRLKVSNIKHH